MKPPPMLYGIFTIPRYYGAGGWSLGERKMETGTPKSKQYGIFAALVAAVLMVAGLEPPANQAVGEYLVALVASIF